MKKFLIIFTLLSLLFTLVACTKTEVENELNQQREDDIGMSDEEFEATKDDPEFQEDYIEAYEEAKLEESMALVDKLEKGEEKQRNGKGVKGSCNMIQQGSTCIEFYGSIRDMEQIQLGCPDGKASTNLCPEGIYGGCSIGMSLPSAMVTRMYLEGGGEMTVESMKNAKKACDATFVSKWITPNP